MLHHMTSTSSSSASATQSSSSASSSKMRKSAVQRDLNEMKSSMSEISDMALGRNAAIVGNTDKSSNALTTHHPSITDLSKLNGLNSSDTINKFKKKLRSIDNLVSDHDEPMITLADSDDDVHKSIGNRLDELSGSNTTIDTVKFQKKSTKTESKTKVITGGFSSEQATSNLAEMEHLQTGDMEFKQANKAAAMSKRLQVDGVKTEAEAAVLSEAILIRSGDVTQKASNNVEAASIKVQGDTFSADKKAISQSQQSQTMTSKGIISQEEHVTSASQSNFVSHNSVITSSSTQMYSNGTIFKPSDLKLDDLEALNSSSVRKDIDQAIQKYSEVLKSFVHTLKENKPATQETSAYLKKINEVIRRAWAVPTHGHELGKNLCNTLRTNGGLDLLIKNSVQSEDHIQFSSAQLLEQCLTTENRTHVVEHGLDNVVKLACVCMKKPEHSCVGTGIIEHLFKHSEGTCSKVIKLGGLEAVLFECRTNDVDTLRHCASALANLSLYGGAENQEDMINRKVPMWLFPLAFHNDDNIKYYACLAIAVLVANKEIEAEVLKSGCLDLVEPFVTSKSPSEFAKSYLEHAHGQSKQWLERLVPVLSSNREEARSLAAFHFCMEAGIKAERGNRGIFHEIGAIEALKTVASCPNAIASKFAAQALRLIGEDVPHKLSQQVPLWSVEDVQAWVKQIGFGEFENQFKESQVDGDLLLNLSETNLRCDIGITNGIRLKRFKRELKNLKRRADYSSKDSAKINHFLTKIGPEYTIYTYAMINAGIDNELLPQLNEDMLTAECGIKNGIHRVRILNAVRNLEKSLTCSSEEHLPKTLDVFVSYRRSNGSQLASLLKVHLQLRGFSVFIDVERLEAGKFDNGLLSSIVNAKNFLLVCTPNALDRCINDADGKDWVHREIVAAINAKCKIIPILDQQFMWPQAEQLPEDMRTISGFNGIPWIHDYQDACIEKIERFIRGEMLIPPNPAAVTYQRMSSNDPEYNGSGGGSGSGVNGGVATTSGSNGNNANDYGGGGRGQANHQANRYRQPSSSARGGGSNNSLVNGLLSSSQLNLYGRNSRRNMLPPYRTQQHGGHKLLTVGGSMQNMSPLAYQTPRRSSDTPAEPGSISAPVKVTSTTPQFRSQSVDGLLSDSGNNVSLANDRRIAEVAALVAAGSTALTNASSSTSTLQPSEAPDTDLGSTLNVEVQRREKLPPTNAHHRKSRSLDHFSIDPIVTVCLPEATEGTQSMQNLATAPITPDPSRGVRTMPFPQRAVARQSPEGISSAEDDHEEEVATAAVPSKTTSVGAIAVKNSGRAPAHLHRSSILRAPPNGTVLGANQPNNQTIFNRTMKKVRSLIKKP